MSTSWSHTKLALRVSDGSIMKYTSQNHTSSSSSKPYPSLIPIHTNTKQTPRQLSTTSTIEWVLAPSSLPHRDLYDSLCTSNHFTLNPVDFMKRRVSRAHSVTNVMPHVSLTSLRISICFARCRWCTSFFTSINFVPSCTKKPTTGETQQKPQIIPWTGLFGDGSDSFHSYRLPSS